MFPDLSNAGHFYRCTWETIDAVTKLRLCSLIQTKTQAIWMKRGKHFKLLICLSDRITIMQTVVCGAVRTTNQKNALFFFYMKHAACICDAVMSWWCLQPDTVCCVAVIPPKHTLLLVLVLECHILGVLLWWRTRDLFFYRLQCAAGNVAVSLLTDLTLSCFRWRLPGLPATPSHNDQVVVFSLGHIVQTICCPFKFEVEVMFDHVSVLTLAFSAKQLLLGIIGLMCWRSWGLSEGCSLSPPQRFAGFTGFKVFL